MLKQRLIVFGTDYDRYPSGIQHICDHYLPDNEIIWVETIGMRPPSLTIYDLKRSISKVWGWLVGGWRNKKRNLPPGLSIVNPILIPYPQFTWARRWNAFQVARRVRAEVRRRKWQKAFYAIYTSPTDVDFLGKLGETKSVYYCIDEFSLWPGMNPQIIQALDREITARADLVVVSSDALVKSKADIAREIKLLTHGVDFEHFNKVQISRQGASANDTFKMCYFGLFDDRSNQNLLKALVDAIPNGHLEIIGDVMTDVSLLRKHPRITFTGKIDYAKLPEHVFDVDLFLLPYHVDELGKNINPLKIKEYMATGIPCLATALPEVMKFSDTIFVAKSESEFIAKAASLASGILSYEAAKGYTVAKAESWHQKSSQFANWLTSPRATVRYLQ